MPGDAALVAPSDAPLLRTELYDRLLAILRDHDAAVPQREVAAPVRAVYRRSVAIRIFARDHVPSPYALVDRLDAVFPEGDALLAADPPRSRSSTSTAVRTSKRRSKRPRPAPERRDGHRY